MLCGKAHEQDADLDDRAFPPLVLGDASRPEFVATFLLFPLGPRHALRDIGPTRLGVLARWMLDARLLVKALPVKPTREQWTHACAGRAKLVGAVDDSLWLKRLPIILQGS